jgi:hypothetical protein
MKCEELNTQRGTQLRVLGVLEKKRRVQMQQEGGHVYVTTRGKGSIHSLSLLSLTYVQFPEGRGWAHPTTKSYQVGDKHEDTGLLRYVSSDEAPSYLPCLDALTPLRGICS